MKIQKINIGGIEYYHTSIDRKKYLVNIYDKSERDFNTKISYLQLDKQPDKNCTVDEFFLYIIETANDINQNTKRQYNHIRENVFGNRDFYFAEKINFCDIPMEILTKEHLEQYYTHLSVFYAPQILSVIQNCLLWGFTHYYHIYKMENILRDGFRCAASTDTLKRYIPGDYEMAILKNDMYEKIRIADGKPVYFYPLTYAILLFLIETGIQIGEVAYFEKKDFKIKDGVIYLIRGKDEEITFSQALNDFLIYAYENTEYDLFLTNSNNPKTMRMGIASGMTRIVESNFLPSKIVYTSFQEAYICNYSLAADEMHKGHLVEKFGIAYPTVTGILENHKKCTEMRNFKIPLNENYFALSSNLTLAESLQVSDEIKDIIKNLITYDFKKGDL